MVLDYQKSLVRYQYADWQMVFFWYFQARRAAMVDLVIGVDGGRSTLRTRG